MATTKKPTVKKTSPKTKPAAKRPVTKSVRAKRPEQMQTFKVFRGDPPFFSGRITRQTVYWSILLIYIMIMQVWILNIQLDIIQVTDNITKQIQRS